MQKSIIVMNGGDLNISANIAEQKKKRGEGKRTSERLKRKKKNW